MKYRLYIDEVGNADLKASTKETQRYLSLTGVILSLDHAREAAHPGLERLKETYFDSHPDEPVVFHRKELVYKKSPFEALRRPEVEQRFNHDFLTLISNLDYVVITAAIDKLEHLNRYRRWSKHPYHYCLAVILERYGFWLSSRRARGDVMAESRGGREDLRLKDEFGRICDQGTEFRRADFFRTHLTSKQLKLKAKTTNVAGLQIADLLAYPSYRWMLNQRGVKPLAADFTGALASILERSKYRRSTRGIIMGHGCKWLP